MSLSAMLLVLLSAVLHAGWNLASKRQRPVAGFFLIASLTSGLLLLPLLYFKGDPLLSAMTPRAGLLLLASGLCMALYYGALGGAYRAGDMSIAYPLARSFPVLLVLLVSLCLGHGSQLTRLSVGGMVLVVAGSTLVPLRQFREFSPRRWANATCALALLAAVGTAGYSMLDDAALRLLRPSADSPAAGIYLATTYFCLEVLSSALWLAIYIGCQKAERRSLLTVWQNSRGPAALAGLAIGLSYILILLALAHARDVSYIVGARQLSIPLGALLALLLLGEKAHRPKLVGIGIMSAGLIMLAMG